LATFVLLHGHHLGTWCWTEVRRQLERLGHHVHAPALHGMGERVGELDASSGPARHAREVAGFLEARDLTDVILVGHSYAGMVVSAVAAIQRRRIRRVVFLDAVVLEDGGRLFDLLREAEPSIRAAAAEHGGFGVPPGFPLEALGVEPEDTATEWWERLTPAPFPSFYESLHAPGNPVEHCRPHYIWCTRCSLTAETAAQCRAREGWTSAEIDAGHLAMITAPDLVAAALGGVAGAEP
jgi:pimeloyl-ACP methyl ester carboxylesterase